MQDKAARSFCGLISNSKASMKLQLLSYVLYTAVLGTHGKRFLQDTRFSCCMEFDDELTCLNRDFTLTSPAVGIASTADEVWGIEIFSERLGERFRATIQNGDNCIRFENEGNISVQLVRCADYLVAPRILLVEESEDQETYSLRDGSGTFCATAKNVPVSLVADGGNVTSENNLQRIEVVAQTCFDEENCNANSSTASLLPCGNRSQQVFTISSLSSIATPSPTRSPFVPVRAPSIPRFQPFSDRFERIFLSAMLACFGVAILAFVYKFNLVPQQVNDGFYKVTHLGRGRLTKKDLLEITNNESKRPLGIKAQIKETLVEIQDLPKTTRQVTLDEQHPAAPKLEESSTFKTGTSAEV